MLKKLPQRNNKATLLVIQSTSFCNISCSYCYLEDKDKFSKMSFATFEATLDNLIKSEIDLKNLSIVFHAGEPLAVGVKYYEELPRRLGYRPILLFLLTFMSFLL